MFGQFFKTINGLWKYLALLTGFAMLQTLSVFGFLHLSFNIVLIDAFVFTLTYAILAILIWNTLKYGKFGSLPFLQEALIYIALIGLSLIVIFGVGYGLYEFLLTDISVILYSFLPVRMFLSLLVVLLIIQYFRFKICNYKLNEQPETSEVPESNEEIIKPTKTEILDHVAVKSGSKIHVVLVPDIVCLQSDGDYVQIITTTGKYLKEQTMKYFEENLPSTLFVRVHRTCIVNMQAIARIELYDKQSQQLTLKNGHQIKVSQAGYKLLRSKLHL